ncbi:MAG TPA: hypothetical protein VH761_06890 [Ilumatobacteraceae bacterium]
MHKRGVGLVALFVAASMVVTACGGGADPKAVDRTATEASSGDPQSSDAPSDTLSDTASDASAEVDSAALDAQAAELLAMPSDQQEALVRDLALQFERDLAKVWGLEEALGGAEAADAALREAWTPTIEQARAIKVESLAGIRRSAAPATPNLGEGLFGGLLIVFLGAEGVVTASNDAKEGAKPESRTESDMTLEATISKATLDMDTTHTSSSTGVVTKLKVKVVVLPCPDVNGQFQATSKIDISATKGNVGQTGTMDVKIDGQVDDNATLASKNVDWRMQWADFASGKGQFVDVSGRYSGDSFDGVKVNRSGGNVTSGLVTSAVSLGALFGLMVAGKLAEAAQKGWESGRCVKLEPTASPGPKGLEPSSTSTITAAPRSKVDGGPVGGTVTATLSAGGASVDPSAAPVPADATMTYTAPDQPNQSGTVSLEARSKRGVAKADIVFETGGAAYLIVGGLEDWQVNQVVCDIMQPFQLSSDIGVMQLSGGLSGTYEFNGMFASHYTGTYEITLPPGPGLPGSMIGTGGGSIAGQAGSGSENYVLTPAEPC